MDVFTELDFSVFAGRRRRVLQKLADCGRAVAVLFAAPEQQRSGDTFFPYRQDSDFWYLTGFHEPEAVLLLDGVTQTSVLFCRERDPALEVWNGLRTGVAAAREKYFFDETFAVGQWQGKLPAYLKDRDTLFYSWGRRGAQENALLHAWQTGKTGMNRSEAQNVRDVRDLTAPMRLIKDESEIALLKRAASISAHAHCRAMRTVRAGMHEYRLEAEILHEFAVHGARQPAYASIVAGGKNACILHYVENAAVLRDGDLLMIDAGAEYAGYAGDISRTFPVNGRFSPAQKDVYAIVLAVNEAVIAACRAGVTYQSLSDLAVRLLTQGLIDLKLLSGSLDTNIETQSYRRFYMHGIGHWLGLDVHDVGGRFENGAPTVLRENMCMTVEPGLYIADDADIPAELRGIGVRIEDNVIVRAQNAEVYTHEVPKSIAAIETLMRG